MATTVRFSFSGDNVDQQLEERALPERNLSDRNLPERNISAKSFGERDLVRRSLRVSSSSPQPKTLLKTASGRSYTSMYDTPRSGKQSLYHYSRAHTVIDDFTSLPDSLYDRPSGWCIIDPVSPAKVMWDLVAMLLIIYQSFMTPWELSFGDENGEVPLRQMATGWFIVEQVIVSFFIVDIFTAMCTGYIENGQVVMKHRKIMKNYLTGWFALDVAVLIPSLLELLIDEGNPAEGAEIGRTSRTTRTIRVIRLFRLARLLRIARASRAMSVVETALMHNTILLTTMRTLGLLVVVALSCHSVACIFRVLGGFRAHADEFGTVDEGSYSEYVFGVYWAVACLTVECPGPPFNLTEQYFNTATNVFGLVIVAASISAIFNAVQAMRDQRRVLHLRLRAASRFVRRHHLSRTLGARIHSTLCALHEHGEIDKAFRDQVEPHISPALVYELYGEIYGGILVRFPPFRNTPQRFRQALAATSEARTYSEGEVIFQEGQHADYMLFVVAGRVKLHNRSGFPLPDLMEKAWAGEHSLFHREDLPRPLRSATLTAWKMASVLVIGRDSFVELVQRFNLNEWLKLVTARLHDEHKPLGCSYCGGDNHWVVTCPNLTHRYTPAQMEKLRQSMPQGSLVLDEVALSGTRSRTLASLYGGRLLRRAESGPFSLKKSLSMVEKLQKAKPPDWRRVWSRKSESGYGRQTSPETPTRRATSEYAGKTGPGAAANLQKEAAALPELDRGLVLRTSVFSEHSQRDGEPPKRRPSEKRPSFKIVPTAGPSVTGEHHLQPMRELDLQVWPPRALLLQEPASSAEDPPEGAGSAMVVPAVGLVSGEGAMSSSASEPGSAAVQGVAAPRWSRRKQP